MMNHLLASIKPFLITNKFDVVYSFIRQLFFINKVAVITENDLSSLLPIDETLKKAGVKLERITSELLLPESKSKQPLVFTDKKRQRKAIDYLEKGYHGVGLISGNEVLGDIWYTSSFNNKKRKTHPDFKFLKIECGDKEAYAFDMLLQPGKRGHNLANILQSSVLLEIKKDGYQKAFGYYWAENIPALWVHRTLQWKELKKQKVSRFIWMYHTRVYQVL